jgi:hypothetical protein
VGFVFSADRTSFSTRRCAASSLYCSLERVFMPSIPLIPNIYERMGPDINRSLIPSDQMPAFSHIVTLMAELALYERNC